MCDSTACPAHNGKETSNYCFDGQCCDFLQVHPHGLRHIRSDKRVNEWRAPGRRTITKAATNERQVVIALSGGECIYFEQDTMGQLVETEKKEMSGDVASLDVGPVPEGRQRSRFLAVGSYDNTVSCLPCVLGLSCMPCLLCMLIQFR